MAFDAFLKLVGLMPGLYEAFAGYQAREAQAVALLRHLVVEVRANLALLDAAKAAPGPSPEAAASLGALAAELHTDLHMAVLALATVGLPADVPSGGGAPSSGEDPGARSLFAGLNLWRGRVVRLPEQKGDGREEVEASLLRSLEFVCSKTAALKGLSRVHATHPAALKTTRFGARFKNLASHEKNILAALRHHEAIAALRWTR